jgi:hypothetical protein
MRRRITGGGGEIRTHERLSPLTVFKTVAFNRSATPPGVSRALFDKPPLRSPLLDGLPAPDYCLTDGNTTAHEIGHKKGPRCYAGPVSF